MGSTDPENNENGLMDDAETGDEPPSFIEQDPSNTPGSRLTIGISAGTAAAAAAAASSTAFTQTENSYDDEDEQTQIGAPPSDDDNF